MFPETIVFTVTEADIGQGERCSGSRCAAALALQRELTRLGLTDEGIKPGVCQYFVALYRYDTSVAQYSVPEDLLRFIEAFDHHKDGREAQRPTPGTFIIRRKASHFG